jgi:hypothetical protein
MRGEDEGKYACVNGVCGEREKEKMKNRKIR